MSSARNELETWKGRYRSSVETYHDIRDENARLRAELDRAEEQWGHFSRLAFEYKKAYEEVVGENKGVEMGDR